MATIARLADYVTPAPAAVLPVQFQRRPPTRPEERLMLAVLEDALTCFQRGAFATDPRGGRLFSEACAWIYCRDREWPFSFENICGMFSIDPEYIRSALARWARLALAHTNRTGPTAIAIRRMEETLKHLQVPVLS